MSGWADLTMVINATDFLYGGCTLFFKDPITGRCYELYDPLALSGREANNKVLTAKPVRLNIYSEYLDNCREVSMKGARRA
ncbi:MAG: hypothetical protein LBF74_06160 [Treponema sp.]|jgi:hypothetical protein|nr:hypothetical protein [Treponema sp.]